MNEFETWLVRRTEKQKNEHFGITPAEELLRINAQKVPTAKELLEKFNKRNHWTRAFTNFKADSFK